MKKIIFVFMISQIIFYFCNSKTFALDISTGANIDSGSSYDQKLQQRADFLLQIKKQYQQDQWSDSSKPKDDIDLKNAKINIDQINSQLEDLSKQFDDLTAKKNQNNAKYTEVKKSMKKIIDKSLVIRKIVDDRITKLNLYTKQMIEIKKQLEEWQNSLDNIKTYLVNFSNIIYNINNEYYNKDTNQIDDIKLILKSENIANTLSSEELLKILSARFTQLINYIQIKQRDLQDKQDVYNKFRVQYKEEVASYQNEIELINEQKKYLLDFIKLYREDKINLEMEDQSMFDDFNKVKAAIAQYISQTKTLSQSTKATLGSVSAWDTGQDINYLSWPIYPVRQMIWSRNDMQYISSYDKNNKWIDISSDMFSTVYSPADWLVYKVKNNDWIALNYIIILHPNGYTTMMSSLNKIYVKEWDKLTRWQVIGISGWEPGTRWAWVNSNWPKLHIEVYKNGEMISPFGVMDLSVIMDTKTLPLEYEIKLTTDKQSRSIDMSSVPIMPGNSVWERRLSYLNQNWFGEFAKLSTREDASNWRYVDIDLWICIAVAETSLGRNFASARNVGNVGNNDRGDRVDYGSASEWASMIYYALENKYLWKYNTLDKLSGYGNQDWAIYASSPINRQTNVTKCLTSIKWYRIPDNRAFRIPKDK